MAVKIYKKNNYCIVEDGAVKRYFAGDEVSLYVDNGNWVLVNSSQKNESFSFNFADLQDEDGVAVGTAEQVEEYLTLNTNFKADAGSSASLVAKSGYSRTSAFVDSSVSYTQQDVDTNLYKVFSFNEANHSANDNPYWSTPTPSGTTGIGLFQGANLPDGVTSLMDYAYIFNDNYPSGGSTGFEGSTGRIKLNDLVYGDQIRVRFDFNVIPQISNTTVEPALWYSNRNDSDDITFTFPLTAQPIFYGGGTVGNTYLNRVEISAWITSNEDVNALALPAIKSDNPIIIEPIGILITVIR